MDVKVLRLRYVNYYVQGIGTVTTTTKSCIQFNVEYQHLDDVPTIDPCLLCQCDNGEVKCAQQICPGPPEDYENCTPVRQEGLCCPNYECDERKVRGIF